MSLLHGKKGVVMGVANDHSIAWGISKKLSDEGAELCFTYQGESLHRRVKPLANSIKSNFLIECDVLKEGSVRKSFDEIGNHWGEIDFVLHSIAFSEKEELKGKYLNTSRNNFSNTMLISCFSFTEVAHEAEKLMRNGGSLLTLTYDGSQKYIRNYNVMGVAKAALESSVRYLAADLGPSNIRVNALSAGPMKTLAGAAISGSRGIFRHSEKNAPLGRNPDIFEVGGAGCYLISDLASGVTGEIHYVDGGFNNVGVPPSNV